MSYHLTIEEKPSYLHARVAGTHDVENVRRFLVEVHEACMQRNYSAVLLEMNLSGQSLTALNIFDTILERSPHGQELQRIAYVDVSSERDPEQMRFAETVARNRGVNVRLFRTLDDAERWLRGFSKENGEPAG